MQQPAGGGQAWEDLVGDADSSGIQGGGIGGGGGGLGQRGDTELLRRRPSTEAAACCSSFAGWLWEVIFRSRLD